MSFGSEIAMALLVVGMTTAIAMRPRGKADQWDPFAAMAVYATMLAFIITILPFLTGGFFGEMLAQIMNSLGR